MPFTWTTPRRLAALALALGALALAGDPVRGHRVTIDTQELATIVGSKVDHVTPAELAAWIVRGASDYRLIDLRDESEFAAYHIPTAENVPITRLPDYGLRRNEKIVLYSEGGIHSAQAWMLLRAEGFTGPTILFGGLEAWRDDVVYPAAPAAPTPEQRARFERASQLAQFFGGHAREASAAVGAGVSLSDVAARPAPTTPIVTPLPTTTTPTTGARKTKEGC